MRTPNPSTPDHARLWGCLVLLLGTLFLFSSSPLQAQSRSRYEAESEAELYLKRGILLERKAIAENEEVLWRQAASSFERAIKNDPSLIQAYPHLGYSLYVLREHKHAVKLLRAGLKKAPNDPDIKHHLGLHLIRLGETKEAIPYLEASISGSTSRPEVHFVLGKYYLEHNHLQNAQRHFEAYHTINPSDPQGNRALGYVYFQQGNLSSALLATQHILDVSSDDADAWSLLGRIHHAKRDHDQSINAYQHLVKLDPHNLEARYNLASLLLLTKQYQAAFDAFSQVAEASPKTLAAQYFKGISAARIGKVAAAESAFKNVLKLDPDYPYGHLQFAALLLQKGDHTGAVVSIGRATLLAPNDPEIRSTAGDIFRNSGLLPDALKEHTSAAALEPDKAKHRTDMGVDLLLLKEFPDAKGRFEEALARHPKHSTATEGLSTANLYLGAQSTRKQHLGQAKKNFNAALSLGVHPLEAHLSLGAIALKQNHLKEALSHAEKARAIAPKHPTLARLSARILVRQGRDKEAITALKQLISDGHSTPQSWHDIAASRAALGQWSRATQALDKARAGGLKSPQDDALAQIILGIERARSGDWSSAQTLLNSASVQKESIPLNLRLRTRYVQGLLLLRQGNHQDALQRFEALHKQIKESKLSSKEILGDAAKHLPFLRAYLLYLNAQPNAALVLLDAAPKTPGSAALSRALLRSSAHALHSEGAHRRALKLLDESLQGTSSGKHELDRAVILHAQGQRPKAAAILKKLANASAPTPTAVYNYALHLDSARDPEAALIYYSRYLEMGSNLPRQKEIERLVSTRRKIFGTEGGK